MRKMVLAMVLVLCTVLVTACGVIEHPRFITENKVLEEGYYGFTELIESDFEKEQYIVIQDQNAWLSEKKVKFKKVKLVNDAGKQMYLIRSHHYNDEAYTQSVLDAAKKKCTDRNIEVSDNVVYYENEDTRYFFAYLDDALLKQIQLSGCEIWSPLMEYYYSKEDGKWYWSSYLGELYNWSMAE
ncbi:MAG: hypothetical protein J6L92_08640 [Clostridia bacterium]|nr:hypothetical protein [Clostridia bacterium]